MQQIPAAFAAMANYRQWMIYKLVPSRKKPGKTDKLPCHPVTAAVVTAHDPANWTDAQTAVTAAQAMGADYGVAFVLTAQDPFWFLDIDGAAQGAAWSPLATDFLTYFAGCAVEVSSSGTGLHIIGSGAQDIGEHRKKNIPLNLEFYTDQRFIALTGFQAVGDSGFTPVAQNLQWLVQTYFPPGDADGEFDDSEPLTDAPVAEWNGPQDDDDLLRRALRSMSTGGAFGGRASFADLWEARADVLARCYPPDSSGSGAWDGSSADSALASHLAFWTGKHGERIRALMMRSALRREKWERDDYLTRTINRACAAISKVLADKPVDAPGIAIDLPPVATTEITSVVHGGSDAATTATRSAESEVRGAGASIVFPSDQAKLFQGCVYVRALHKVFVPSGELLKPEVFNVAYGGYVFPLDNENTARTTSAWEAFAQSRALRHTQVAATCFRPSLPPGCIVDEAGRTAVNTWVPPMIVMREGDPAIFEDHLRRLFPDERDRTIIVSYLAALVQYPGHKFKWCPVIQGVPGNGKTFLSHAAEYAVGKEYTHWPLAKEITKNFNAWLFGNLLYCVEDMKVSARDADLLEDIKPMITGERIQIEAKGVDQVARDVCGNFIFNTNHKGGMKKRRDDRRLAPFFTPQQDPEDLIRDGMGSQYMTRLYDWAKGEGDYAAGGANFGFSIIAHYLKHFQIPDEFNPAGACQRAPETTSTAEALSAGLNTAEQYIAEAVEEGRQGFLGGFISSTYLSRLLEEVGRPQSPQNRSALMRGLGYIPHPALPRGRTNNTVNPDGNKPILYVHVENRKLLALDSPAAVAAEYTKSQIRN